MSSKKSVKNSKVNVETKKLKKKKTIEYEESDEEHIDEENESDNEEYEESRKLKKKTTKKSVPKKKKELEDEEEDNDESPKKKNRKTEVVYDDSYQDDDAKDKKKSLKKNKEVFLSHNYLDKELSNERNLEIIMIPNILKIVLDKISQVTNEISFHCVQPSENCNNEDNNNYFEEMGENADLNLEEKSDDERGGIYVVKLNEDQNAYIKFHLYANRFQYFKCEGTVKLSIELSPFLQLIKSFEDNVPIYIYQNRSNDSCFFIEQLDTNRKNNKTIGTKRTHVKTVSQTQDAPTIEKQKFENIVAIGSGDFAAICKDLSVISDNIEIRSSGKQITFKCINDSGSTQREFVDTTNEINGSPMIQGTYNLKIIYNFSKCNKICDKVLLFLKNGFPLTLYFDLHKEGKMWILVAPLNTDDSDVQNN